MSNSREERTRQYHALLAMKPQVEAELLKVPGVRFVSVGLKLTGGRIAGDICFTIHVDKKKAPADISAMEILPSAIQGIKTDVNEIPTDISFSGDDMGKYRPLSGGARVVSSKHEKESGTLGCLAITDADSGDGGGDVVLLSCYHVLMSNGEEEGHQVGQPDFCCDDCCCRCGEVAILVTGFWDDHNVDCAIAKLSNGNEDNWTNEVLETGPISCIPVNEAKVPLDPFNDEPKDHLTGNPYLPVLPGDTVFKRGMHSGLTEGVVVNPAYPTFTIVSLSKTFHNQILIHPKDPAHPFSGKGDSGSVVLNHLNQVVGLFFADNEQRDSSNQLTAVATAAYANPIQDVLLALKISIPTTGSTESLPLKSEMDIKRIPRMDPADELAGMIEQREGGADLIRLFRIHRKEVMQLINTDREVKLAWNRYKGPSFVAHLLEKAKHRDYPAPAVIEGVSMQRLLTKMSVVLEKKGSKALSSTIEAETTRVLLMLADLMNEWEESSKAK